MPQDYAVDDTTFGGSAGAGSTVSMPSQPASPLTTYSAPSGGGGGGGGFNFSSVLAPLIGIAPLFMARGGKKGGSPVAHPHSGAMMPALGGGIPLWMIVGGGVFVLGGVLLFAANRD